MSNDNNIPLVTSINELRDSAIKSSLNENNTEEEKIADQIVDNNISAED
jgi:hypothetical protein